MKLLNCQQNLFILLGHLDFKISWFFSALTAGWPCFGTLWPGLVMSLSFLFSFFVTI